MWLSAVACRTVSVLHPLSMTHIPLSYVVRPNIAYYARMMIPPSDTTHPISSTLFCIMLPRNSYARVCQVGLLASLMFFQRKSCTHILVVHAHTLSFINRSSYQTTAEQAYKLPSCCEFHRCRFSSSFSGSDILAGKLCILSVIIPVFPSPGNTAVIQPSSLKSAIRHQGQRVERWTRDSSFSFL